MPTLTQLTVSCEDRPGTLARIARLLGKADINILALLATAAGETGLVGFVGLVVDRPDKAKKVFAAAHMHYTEQPVLHIELRNTPGALASFAEKVSKEGINITAAYETSVRGAKTASVVLAVSDFEKAARIRQVPRPVTGAGPYGRRSAAQGSIRDKSHLPMLPSATISVPLQ